MKKLKGFSLMEVMIVLALGGLVYSSGMQIWKVISAIHLQYTQQQAALYESIHLQQILERDAMLVRKVEQVNEGKWILTNGIEDTLATYQLNSPWWLRQHRERIDSFAVSGSIHILENQQGFILSDTINGFQYQFIPWQKARL